MQRNQMTLDAHPDNPPEARGLRAIGYWRPSPRQIATHDELQRILIFNGQAPSPHPELGLPSPHDFVDMTWYTPERMAVVRYLERNSSPSHTLCRWRGWSTCRICDVSNGSVCVSDGAYVWPEGFVHYVRDHYVRPDQEFIEHALRCYLTRST